MRLLLISVFVSLCAIQTWAQSDSDSVSVATATAWGHTLKPQVDRNYQGDSVAVAKYMAGLKQAFATPLSEEPYYTGIMQGLILADRIKQMQSMGFPIDVEVMCRALSDFIEGKPTGFTNESANNYLNDYLSRNTPVDTVDVASQQAFIDKQLERDNVVKTASGLVFETIIDGVGEHPSTTDKVKLLYTGRLADGTVFDSTDEPVIFEVNRLVKGFTEGLLLMKAEGTYRLFIPAELGYGERGIEGVIPGNAALDFEVKLLEIIK